MEITLLGHAKEKIQQARAAQQGPPMVEAISARVARQKSRSLIRDLEALLLIFANHVPLGYYDMVLEQATSIQSTLLTLPFFYSLSLDCYLSAVSQDEKIIHLKLDKMEINICPRHC